MISSFKLGETFHHQAVNSILSVLVYFVKNEQCYIKVTPHLCECPSGRNRALAVSEETTPNSPCLK